MIYDKACGNVRLTVMPQTDSPPAAMIVRLDGHGAVEWLTLEDLRDLRHLIDAALRAAK